MKTDPFEMAAEHITFMIKDEQSPHHFLRSLEPRMPVRYMDPTWNDVAWEIARWCDTMLRNRPEPRRRRRDRISAV